jgi:radical SAM protein with 4Fe4S-binding SPASM domain
LWQEAQIIALRGETVHPIDSLIHVELNPTELCNRVCAFCPRVDASVYPNQNLHLDLNLVRKVATDLAGRKYTGRVSMSNFGEPLLAKGFLTMIRILREHLPKGMIDVNTNGDRLTPKKIREIFDAGLSFLYVNMYDGPEQAPKFHQMFADAGLDRTHYKLRAHWVGSTETYGLYLNNRSGMVTNTEMGLKALDAPLRRRCYFPFYRMMIDWNGDVLLCSNDWARKFVAGNVRTENLFDIWMSEKMWEARRRLARDDRNLSPCNKCDTNGLLSGESSFNILMQHYADEGKITKQELDTIKAMPVDLDETESAGTGEVPSVAVR